jgi:hypothetical protein
MVDTGEKSWKADLGQTNGRGQARGAAGRQQEEAGPYQQAGGEVQCESERDRIENREPALISATLPTSLLVCPCLLLLAPCHSLGLSCPIGLAEVCFPRLLPYISIVSPTCGFTHHPDDEGSTDL